MKTQNMITGVLLGVASSGSGLYLAEAEDNTLNLKVETVIVASISEAENSENSAPFIGEIGASFEKKHYFDNGMTLGFVGELRFQNDNKNRQGFSTPISFGDEFEPTNQLVGNVSSPTTGIGLSNERIKNGPYGSIEQAFAYLKSGWGEVSVGRDIGAASRLDARAPKILQYGSLNSPRLNVTSSSIVRSRNDVTGPSAKITYMTPRIIGLRLGGSYTPKANSRGIDFGSHRDVESARSANLENVLEAGLSYSHFFRHSDVKMRLGLTGIMAQTQSINSLFNDYSAIGIGAEFEKNQWSVGIRHLESNNALAEENGDYSALEAGILKEIDKWTFGAEYGAATDNLLNLEGENWAVGFSRDLNNNVNLGFSYFDTTTSTYQSKMSASGAQFELIVRYE